MTSPTGRLISSHWGHAVADWRFRAFQGPAEIERVPSRSPEQLDAFAAALESQLPLPVTPAIQRTRKAALRHAKAGLPEVALYYANRVLRKMRASRTEALSGERCKEIRGNIQASCALIFGAPIIARSKY